MSVAVGFWVAFGATVLMLGVALVSGFGGRRRVHLYAGPIAIACLGVAVFLAEQLVRYYTFPKEQMRIHLVFAFGTAGLALLVVGTGLLLVRRPALRRWHRACVLAFATGTLVATGTGIWVWSLAVPK